MTKLQVIASWPEPGGPSLPPGAILEAVERQPLTLSQRQVYDAVVALYGAKGQRMTYKDIGATLGLSSPAGIARSLAVLEAKGWIRPRTGFARRQGIVVPLPSVPLSAFLP